MINTINSTRFRPLISLPIIPRGSTFGGSNSKFVAVASKGRVLKGGPSIRLVNWSSIGDWPLRRKTSIITFRIPRRYEEQLDAREEQTTRLGRGGRRRPVLGSPRTLFLPLSAGPKWWKRRKTRRHESPRLRENTGGTAYGPDVCATSFYLALHAAAPFASLEPRSRLLSSVYRLDLDFNLLSLLWFFVFFFFFYWNKTSEKKLCRYNVCWHALYRCYIGFKIFMRNDILCFFFFFFLLLLDRWRV